MNKKALHSIILVRAGKQNLQYSKGAIEDKGHRGGPTSEKDVQLLYSTTVVLVHVSSNSLTSSLIAFVLSSNILGYCDRNTPGIYVLA